MLQNLVTSIPGSSLSNLAVSSIALSLLVMPPTNKRKATQEEVQAGRADVIVPIVVGSYSRKLPIPEGSELGQVYEWVVCLRSAEDPIKDLSPWIASVEFSLHPSFLVSKRLVSEQPFMVREEGWGEFPIGIKVNFAIDGVPPISMTHQLKLISPGPYVVNEKYDQICIAVPSDWKMSKTPTKLQRPIEDELLNQLMNSYHGIASLEESALLELSHDLSVSQANVDRLRKQAIALEEEYLKLKLAKIS